VNLYYKKGFAIGNYLFLYKFLSLRKGNSMRQLLPPSPAQLKGLGSLKAKIQVKRRDLIKHLEKHGCAMVREGANHTVYKNLKNGNITAIPRHREIKNILCRKICVKDLEIEIPF
jgi:mRNA interferase HicA